MITEKDMIPLPYMPELPVAGCLYACRGLLHAADYERASRYAALREAAAQAVIELALQRFLVEHNIPYYLEAVAPFTAPDHASLVLGGRVCQVLPMLSEHALAGRQGALQAYLEESRLPLPAKRGLPDAHEDEELLIYGAVWRKPELQDAAFTHPESPAEMVVHPLPASWAQPQMWTRLGEVQVKSTSSGVLRIWLEGQNEQRQYLSETLSLLAGEPQGVPPGFYALAALRADHQPDGTVAILRKGDRQAYGVGPHQWAALWRKVNEIRLLGYLSRGEARRMAPSVPGTTIPLTKLRPLPELFERVKGWARGRMDC